MHKLHKIQSVSALFVLSAIMLSACGTPSSPPSENSPSASSTTSTTQEIKEGSTLSSRIALTYDGGVMMVDGRTMKLINTLDKEGFCGSPPQAITAI